MPLPVPLIVASAIGGITYLLFNKINASVKPNSENLSGEQRQDDNGKDSIDNRAGGGGDAGDMGSDTKDESGSG